MPLLVNVAGVGGPAATVLNFWQARFRARVEVFWMRSGMLQLVIREIVAQARQGVPRILVLRNDALQASAGVDADAVVGDVIRAANDFWLLRVTADRRDIGGVSRQALLTGHAPPVQSTVPEPWSVVRELTEPLLEGAPIPPAALPWAEVEGWSVGSVARRARGRGLSPVAEDRLRAVYARLIEAAAEQPVLCVLENAPWYDGTSIWALRRISSWLLEFDDGPASPRRVLMIVTGGRRGDPWEIRTSLGPGPLRVAQMVATRRDHQYQHTPFVLHQPEGADAPRSLIEGGHERAVRTRGRPF